MTLVEVILLFWRWVVAGTLLVVGIFIFMGRFPPIFEYYQLEGLVIVMFCLMFLKVTRLERKETTSQ